MGAGALRCGGGGGGVARAAKRAKTSGAAEMATSHRQPKAGRMSQPSVASNTAPHVKSTLEMPYATAVHSRGIDSSSSVDETGRKPPTPKPKPMRSSSSVQKPPERAEAKPNIVAHTSVQT